MKITASIVIYNEHKNTLKKVIEGFLDLRFEKKLFIIDNSSKNILEKFCSSYENVVYIFSGKNLGFGKAHNLILKDIVDSEIHLILNPDIYFQTLELGKFLEWFDSCENVSLAIPKVLNVDGTVQDVVRDIPTPISLLKRKLKIENGELMIADKSTAEIPFAHGCFMAFKSDVFQKLGGFDERYFMYMEDIDIWIRAKKYGKTVINTNFSIYHEHRKGSSKSFKLLFYHIHSAIQFFWKFSFLDKNFVLSKTKSL